MSKAAVFVLTVISALQYDSAGANPLPIYEQSVNIEIPQDTRTLEPAPKEWLRSWSLPTIPIFSVCIKDEDLTAVKEKIATLEESQKEVLELLKLYIKEYKSPLNNKTTTSNNNEQAENKGKVKPEGSDEKGETHENTKKDPSQSVSATINGDSAAATTNADKGSASPTKLDGKEKTPKNGVQINAVVNGNKENEMTLEHSEQEKLTEALEKVENSGELEELLKIQLDPPLNKNVQPASLTIDVVKRPTELRLE